MIRSARPLHHSLVGSLVDHRLRREALFHLQVELLAGVEEGALSLLEARLNRLQLVVQRLVVHQQRLGLPQQHMVAALGIGAVLRQHPLVEDLRHQFVVAVEAGRRQVLDAVVVVRQLVRRHSLFAVHVHLQADAAVAAAVVVMAVAVAVTLLRRVAHRTAVAAAHRFLALTWAARAARAWATTTTCRSGRGLVLTIALLLLLRLQRGNPLLAST
ncbi:hypothetical protein TYRP_002483 [Tyrophagus putrescentiae]|nr:hypothetical protein TYRP_002483 [Tyrophagus putrescentiae]